MEAMIPCISIFGRLFGRHLKLLLVLLLLLELLELGRCKRGGVLLLLLLDISGVLLLLLSIPARVVRGHVTVIVPLVMLIVVVHIALMTSLLTLPVHRSSIVVDSRLICNKVSLVALISLLVTMLMLYVLLGVHLG